MCVGMCMSDHTSLVIRPGYLALKQLFGRSQMLGIYSPITEYIFESTEDIGTLDMSSEKKVRCLGKPDYISKIDT